MRIIFFQTPPVGIFDQHRADIGLTQVQNKRSGAVGMTHRIGFLTRRCVLRLDDVMFLRPAARHNEDVVDLLRQDRIGAIGDDPDGKVVHGHSIKNRADDVFHIRCRAQCPGKGEDHIICREGAAIVKGNARTQFEFPHGGVFGQAPGERKTRRQRHGFSAIDQRFVDLLGGGEGHAFVLSLGVEGDGIALGRPADDVFCLRGNRGKNHQSNGKTKTAHKNTRS